MDDEAKCHVRRAVVTDSDTIAALSADVPAIHAAAIPWLFKPPVDIETLPSSAVAALLMKNETLMYLALNGQQAIGYIYQFDYFGRCRSLPTMFSSKIRLISAMVAEFAIRL